MGGVLGRGRVLTGLALLVVGFIGGALADRFWPSAPRTVEARAAGGGFPWPFFAHPRAADAGRAPPPRPAGFAVWTSRLDTAGSAPRACVRMSEPLDPRRSYGDFVVVNPSLAHPAAVTAVGDELCVADVGYDARTITLLHGLPSAGRAVLDADVDVAFAPGSKPPYVGFAGQGVILPREDADGVGLETVNVSRLHVEVWRVPDRNLVRKEISAPDPTGEDEYDFEGGRDGVGDDGRRLWSGNLSVRGPADQRVTTVFPLGAVLKTLEPGAYVVIARDASGLKGARNPTDEGAEGDDGGGHTAQARRWIVFTDMALQAYDGSDALDVLVRSLKTAHALAGVRLALVGKDGGDLASALTDGQGHVRFPRTLLAGQAGASPKAVMAYGPRGDFTVLDLERAPVDLSKQNVDGRTIPGGTPQTGKSVLDTASAVDAFLYADRGIYRPGETAHLVGLLRDRFARSVKDRSGAVIVRRPSGLEFSRMTFKAAPDGAVAFDAAIPAGAPRGMWKADLQMDGSDQPSGEIKFQVEDFAPQRLAVNLAANPERAVVSNERRPVAIDARFLYGAAAVGLPVRVEGRLAADPDPFPAFKGFAWGDQQAPFPEKLLQAPPTTTDGAGHAQSVFSADASVETPVPLSAQLTASVFEPGGRPVSEETSLKVRTRPLYLGVKTTSGSGAEPVQTFEIIALDALGRRRAASGVHWLLIAEHWDYDWFEKDGRWGWRRTSRDIPIAEGRLDVAAGASARIAHKLPWGDYRLVLEDEAERARTVIRNAAGWGEPVEGVEPPDTARLGLERAGYRTGDTVAVRIQAPFAGEAQVAVATDHLLTVRSVHVPQGGATLRLHADESWGGGAYVLATVVQPRDPVASPKPRRALGVIWVPLQPAGRKLTVVVNTPPKVDFNAPVVAPLTVRGLGPGERAHVTLAAVDEGILRLTHQKNPDPAAWYFGKRALGLAYRDDYGRLLDPNLGPAAAVSFGGDEFGGAELSVVPIRTVALWSGMVTTDAGGHARIVLPKAQFNGQLRLVAVAWTDKAVGSGASDMIVREPVVAEVSTPRFLAPGDRAQATLELDNVEGRPGAYDAALAGRGGVGLAWRKSFTLEVGRKAVERVAVTAPGIASIGAVDMVVRGPGFSARRSLAIQTRPGWGRVSRVQAALQRPGEAFTPSPALLAGLAPGATMTVSYSTTPGVDPEPLAESLANYPFGCSEQLASTAWPLLYAQDFGRPPPAGRSAALNVARLLDREALDGSIGLWRVGDGEATPWVGAYVVDLLLEAQAHGAPVSFDALRRALVAMREVAQPDGFAEGFWRETTWGPTVADPKAARDRQERAKDQAAAYALYDLAKARQGDLARLRWFHDVEFAKMLSPLARAQIGAGLAAMGDRGRAHDSFVQAVRSLGYKDPWDAYQSPLRDLADVVALAAESGEAGIARGLIPRLRDAARSPDELNTQEAAALVRAAHALRALAGPARIQAVGVSSLGALRWSVGRLAAARFVNAGSGPIWRTVTVVGTPLTPPPMQSNGFTLEKRLFTLTGAPADPGALRQGERIIVRLSGRPSAQRRINAVVDDPLPAGFEIEGTLTPADAQGAPDSDGKRTAGAFAFLGELTPALTQEKRDDRYIGSLALDDGKPFAVAYVVRVVSAGDFFLPAAEVRDMYRPPIVARTGHGRARIVGAP